VYSKQLESRRKLVQVVETRHVLSPYVLPTLYGTRRRVAARSRWRAAFMAVRFVTWTTSLSRENSREGAARDAADAAKAEAAVTEVGEVAAAGPALQPDASTTRSRGWLYRITAGAPSVRQPLRTSSGP